MNLPDPKKRTIRMCLRCGSHEFRIDGYCTIYCRDMAEVEAERDEARAALTASESRVEEVEGERDAWRIKTNALADKLKAQPVQESARLIAALLEQDQAEARADRLEEALRQIVGLADHHDLISAQNVARVVLSKEEGERR